jgi:hypothetical protein
MSVSHPLVGRLPCDTENFCATDIQTEDGSYPVLQKPGNVLLHRLFILNFCHRPPV